MQEIQKNRELGEGFDEEIFQLDQKNDLIKGFCVVFLLAGVLYLWMIAATPQDENSQYISSPHPTQNGQ